MAIKNNKGDLILSALLTYPTIKEASQVVGVTEQTIYEYLKRDDFKAKYQEAKKQMLHNTTTFLQVKLQEATETIVDIMNDSSKAPQVRLNACDQLIRYCVKLTEQTDIIERVEALENQSKL